MRQPRQVSGAIPVSKMLPETVAFFVYRGAFPRDRCLNCPSVLASTNLLASWFSSMPDLMLCRPGHGGKSCRRNATPNHNLNLGTAPCEHHWRWITFWHHSKISSEDLASFPFDNNRTLCVHFQLQSYSL